MTLIYDISLPISTEMPVYKNRIDKRPVIDIIQDFEHGIRESRLQLDCHTGTHLDAPLHVLPGGKGVDSFDLSLLVGRCRVMDLTTCEDSITTADLAAKEINPGDFVLLKTKNSLNVAIPLDFVYLDAGGAAYLAGLPVRGVGIDALGIERNQPGHPTHKSLLQQGIPILEGLQLAEVAEGQYCMAALPLSMATEAAPARVVLWTN